MSKELLYAALHERTGVEVPLPGTQNETETQLRFMARVHRGNPTTLWLGVVRHLLVFSRQPGLPWTLDISKRYFVTPEDDLKYGWRIIIQSSALTPDIFVQLAQQVRGVQVQGRQLEEVQLHGSPTRSRTAGLYGQVPVGPLAIRAR